MAFRLTPATGRRVGAAACVLAVAAGCNFQTVNNLAGGAGTSRASAQSLVNDVYGAPYRTDWVGQPWGKNQAVLRGIPSNFDWAAGAVGRTWDRANYKAVTPWGQIFEAGTAGSSVRNVRVQIRSLQVFWLIGGQWKRATPPSGRDGKVEGAYYSGTFSSASSMGVRDDGYGISSFPLAPIHDMNHPVAHFWWSGWYPRPTVPAGATAMHISVMMRLVPDGPGVNVHNARYIAGVGIDEDRTTTNVPGGAKGSLGMPRHKMLTSSWQRFGFTNLSPNQILQNPPPAVTG
jgi:hypothetical protein